MGKVLKKYTTIPPELYVTRSADKQLERIIEEMQRPGYVLVARQMGKTNLLFNAKRTLENENRLFIYVDMSNLFTCERECYRNIIDNIIEPNDTLFETIVTNLKSIRREELPPHKEYLKSLRIILEQFKGDLVIILDEIDALKSVEYSDNIFSQIRSNYFSRTNFQEFERLTYILSGVIEPIDLIKDRNKSPFNIGEKIYLDDFNEDEHNYFINKSGLQIKQEIKEEIFSWTNGNPRLTFDICSEVESFLLENEEIAIDDLKYLIQKKYLTTFDISPVDHIRELVKSDKKVRSAVLDIQMGEVNNISDEIKKKLYLYGIINSKFDEITVIKNRIIRMSLSVEWIKSIDKQTEDNYNYGIEKLKKFEYEEAIHAFMEYISNSNPPKAMIEVCKYNIGYAYYKLRNFTKAMEYFSLEYMAELYNRNSKSFLGVCKIGLGEQEEGIKILEQIIETKIYDFAYRNAIMNLAPLIISENKCRAIELYEKLLDSTYGKDADINTSEEELNTIRTLAQYYKAEVYIQYKDIENGIKHISLALKYASVEQSIYLKFLKYKIDKKEEEIVKLEIVEKIINNKMKFNSNNIYPISFCEEHLFYYLDLIFDVENIGLFERLLNYASAELYKNKFDSLQLAYLLSQRSYKKSEILNYVLSFNNKISNDSLIQIYRELCIINFNSDSEFIEYFKKYKMLFGQSGLITVNDVHLFAKAIKYYYDIKKFKEGLELCEIICSKTENINDENVKFEFVIIYYWISMLHFSCGNKEISKSYANMTIRLIEECKHGNSSMLGEKGIKLIWDQMQEMIKSFINKTLKYGRNQRVKVQYSDGKIVENKYKKLEVDIVDEKCKLI